MPENEVKPPMVAAPRPPLTTGAGTHRDRYVIPDTAMPCPLRGHGKVMGPVVSPGGTWCHPGTISTRVKRSKRRLYRSWPPIRKSLARQTGPFRAPLVKPSCYTVVNSGAIGSNQRLINGPDGPLQGTLVPSALARTLLDAFLPKGS